MKRREFITLLGSATACPLPMRAQQPPKARRIAIVVTTASIQQLTDATAAPNVAAFEAELRQLGRVEGVNLVIARHSAERKPWPWPEVVHDVLRGGPEVIFTIGFSMAQAFKNATQTIPIVAVVADPIGLGLTASISRPGGNLTGVVAEISLEIWDKRFELLREVVPAAAVALPISREEWESSWGRAIQQAALRVGISLRLAALNAPRNETEYRRAFVAVREQGVGALAIPDGNETFIQRRLIVELVRDLRLAAVYPQREFVVVGGLMSYGADVPDLYRHAARQVDQILKGAKPGEIPFYQATRVEVVINLKTAKALGLTIPSTLLARADEVIE